MAMPRVGLTYEDYAALPDDGRRYEIHDGELSVTPSPNVAHQRVSANLSLDVILDRRTVVQPDIIFMAAAHASRISDRRIEGAPTMRARARSKSTSWSGRRTG